MSRHPVGLYVLFLTEMWERFGFYCMSAIFALYMEDKYNGHPFLQENYAFILGLYLGFVYFTPFFGGIIADRLIGYRWAVVLGGLMLSAGYFLLAYDPLPSFFLGLAVLVAGNGLFKANISTLVGKLYAANDPRLDSAYTIFYMGINVGAFTAPLAAGMLCNRFRTGNLDGYHVAFAAAGVGMVVSLITFLLCRRWIVDHGPSHAAAGPSDDVPPALQRRRHQALLIIFAVVILFWMAFKQNAGTFNFWFRDHTERTPLPWLRDLLSALWLDRAILDDTGQFNKTVQSAINPFFVVTLSPLLVWFWLGMRRRGLELSTPGKVALGMLLTAAAFGIMTVGGLMGGNTGKVSGLYLVSAYAVLTTGELCLSPMGLSLVSKLAAPKSRSMWMGGWFAATAIGGYLSSGVMGRFWKPLPHSTFFAILAATSILAFVVLAVFYRRVNSAMPAAKK